jgi:rhodanese-related sulfurtransferase
VSVREVDIETFARERTESTTVVDVREPDEYVAAHVPGARLIPMGHLAGHLDEIDLDRDQPVYLVCASGNRSGVMGELLEARGFDTVNVLGGTYAWVAAGHATESGLQG